MALEKVLAYFRNVDSLLSQTAENGGDPLDGEAAAIVGKNAFAELAGYEVRLSCHHDGSFVVERLLKDPLFSSPDQLSVFAEALGPSGLGKLLCHRYGSHVVEALLLRHLPAFFLEADDGKRDWLFDTYASKVIRKLLTSEDRSARKAVADAIIWPFVQSTEDVLELARDTNASLVLQDALSVPTDRTPVELLSDAIVLKQLAYDKNGSRVVESWLRHQPDAFSIIKDFAVERAVELLADRSGNYVLQAFIAACTDASALNGLVKALAGGDVDRQLIQHAGVLVKLLEQAGKSAPDMSRSQKPVLSMLQRCFQLESLKDGLDAAALARLLSLDPTESTVTAGRVKPLGCLIAMHLAKISKYVGKAFLTLPPKALMTLALDQAGSRLLESLVDDNGKLAAHVANALDLPTVAVDKYGSHVLEALFKNVSTDADKESIVTALAPKLRQLEGSRHGAMVSKRLRLAEFAHNPERWRACTERSDRRKRMFADILDE